MRCIKCGYEVAEGMKFCPKCGNPISNHDGIKQPNVNHQDVSSKKRNWFVSAAILVAIILGLFLLKGILTSKVNLSEIGECYEINGVKYPSYSQLKYIAVNELSYKEVQEVLAICGLRPTTKEDSYDGEFGSVSLSISDKTFLRYTFYFHTTNRMYINTLKSEIMREEDAEESGKDVSGFINDYWRSGLDDLNDGLPVFNIFFQKSKSGKYVRK